MQGENLPDDDFLRGISAWQQYTTNMEEIGRLFDESGLGKLSAEQLQDLMETMQQMSQELKGLGEDFAYPPDMSALREQLRHTMRSKYDLQ